MYQRLKAALIRPKDNAKYVNDKFGKIFIYLLIYLLLFTVPYVPIFINFSSRVSSQLRSSVKFTEEITYQIKDNQLVSTTEEKNTFKLSVDSSSINDVYLVIGPNVETNNNDLIIHFDEDGIYLSNMGIISKYRLLTYEGLDIDLTKLDKGDAETISAFFGIVKTYINMHLGLVYGIGIPAILIMNAFWVAFMSLLIALMGFLAFRMNGLKFKESYKIATLSLAPAAICFMFSIILSSTGFGSLFYWVGFIITTVFYFKCAGAYIIEKSKNLGDNNNEL